MKLKIKQSLIIILSILTSLSFLLVYVPICKAASNPGLIFAYKEKDGRTWGAWVMDDINGDGWREIGICGAIYTKALDVNPAHGGPKEIWNQWGLHHEVLWGCDSGIDANGDNITEQLVFEAVWNNHYLLNGEDGVALDSPDEENRRYGFFWPIIDCGFGLEYDINGNSVNDYVITGIDYTPRALVQCIESVNATVIWEFELAEVSNGLRSIKINSTQHVLTISGFLQVLTINGSEIWNRTGVGWGLDIIPNGAGFNSDAIITRTGAGVTLINASNNKIIWSNPINLHSLHYVGDINNDGWGDFGGLYSSGYKVGICSGLDGSLIRNHTAQNLLNYMHGATFCGDVNADGYDDYGIFGDFYPHEIFSGNNGSQLISISGEYFYGAEEMYIVPDINDNGTPDIMLFNGGIVAVEGSFQGHVNIKDFDGGGFQINGYPFLIITLAFVVSIIVVIKTLNEKHSKF
ncbi:MAG: hypothetical protein ACFE8B_12590 [Candidatus Hermodarchaeota archaeon]